MNSKHEGWRGNKKSEKDWKEWSKSSMWPSSINASGFLCSFGHSSPQLSCLCKMLWRKAADKCQQIGGKEHRQPKDISVNRVILEVLHRHSASQSWLERRPNCCWPTSRSGNTMEIYLEMGSLKYYVGGASSPWSLMMTSITLGDNWMMSKHPSFSVSYLGSLRLGRVSLPCGHLSDQLTASRGGSRRALWSSVALPEGSNRLNIGYIDMSS